MVICNVLQCMSVVISPRVLKMSITLLVDLLYVIAGLTFQLCPTMTVEVTISI